MPGVKNVIKDHKIEVILGGGGIHGTGPSVLQDIKDVIGAVPLSPADLILKQQEALAAIEAKAAELGFAGSATGDITLLTPGWMRPYQGCDIYYDPATGAHEVHGDIRAKYVALGGAPVLGLPLTDESPAQGGRFNHFQRGSIYYASHIGPMMVRGRIRDVWAATGWEGGELGYPVADEQHLVGLQPGAAGVAWSRFENGAIVATRDGEAKALAATLTPDQLRHVLRSKMDVEVHKSSDNIGLHAPVESGPVSDWSYGFWSAVPRTVTVTLHGFHDNGLLPDTDFDLSMRLRFVVTSPQPAGNPVSLTLSVALEWASVTASGLGSKAVAGGVKDGVVKAFNGDATRPEVPSNALFVLSIPTGASVAGDGSLDVVDVLTTADGGLEVLVNPLPKAPGGSGIGGVRQVIAQNAIDAFVEQLG
jgi:hypothetical protein